MLVMVRVSDRVRVGFLSVHNADKTDRLIFTCACTVVI